jgi:hypothetical protein
VNAEGEQARIRERVEAYCAQARESTAAIELYLALLLQLQEASRNVVEQEQRYNLRDHEVRRLTGGTPAPPADATPGLAWRAVEGAVQFHQDTWNALRQLRPVEPAQD